VEASTELAVAVWQKSSGFEVPREPFLAADIFARLTSPLRPGCRSYENLRLGVRPPVHGLKRFVKGGENFPSGPTARVFKRRACNLWRCAGPDRRSSLRRRPSPAGCCASEATWTTRGYASRVIKKSSASCVLMAVDCCGGTRFALGGASDQMHNLPASSLHSD